MRQFNLQEFIDNPSRKVVTREGRDVRIICTDAKLAFCPIIALIEGDGGKSEYLINYKEDGIPVGFHEAYNTLFFAPEKHEGWINVYRNNDSHTYAGAVYDSKEDAEKRKTIDENYVTTIKIEWEE